MRTYQEHATIVSDFLSAGSTLSHGRLDSRFPHSAKPRPKQPHIRVSHVTLDSLATSTPYPQVVVSIAAPTFLKLVGFSRANAYSPGVGEAKTTQIPTRLGVAPDTQRCHQQQGPSWLLCLLKCVRLFLKTISSHLKVHDTYIHIQLT